MFHNNGDRQSHAINSCANMDKVTRRRLCDMANDSRRNQMDHTMSDLLSPFVYRDTTLGMCANSAYNMNHVWHTLLFALARDIVMSNLKPFQQTDNARNISNNAAMTELFRNRRPNGMFDG